MTTATTAWTGAGQVLDRFLHAQLEELAEADRYLPADEARDLKTYYHGLLSRAGDPEFLRQHVQGGVRSTYGYILESILRRSRTTPPRVLDAGAGFGSECLLFALAGARAVGVDLREERHRVAVKRVPRYTESLGVPLSVEFLLANIFSIEGPGSFDLIWVHNAISHIHPVDGFLRHCHTLLSPGGEIVIVDVNKTSLIKRLKEREPEPEKLYETRKDPQTGEDVIYAVERDLSLAEQCTVLVDQGFDLVHRECYVGFQGKSPEWLYRSVLRPLSRWKTSSSLLGRRYVVVGRRN